jgi:hypothetical protein
VIATTNTALLRASAKVANSRSRAATPCGRRFSVMEATASLGTLLLAAGGFLFIAACTPGDRQLHAYERPNRSSTGGTAPVVTTGTAGGTTVETIGGIKGSYLPAGRNWKLVMADEFDGPQLNMNIWKDWYRPGTIRTAHGGMYQDNTRALSFANGHMVLTGFDGAGLSGNPDNLPGTGGLVSKQKWGPGYYEAREKPGSAWSGFWSEGVLGNCGSITDGFEADILESYGFGASGHSGLIWGDYGRCEQQSGNWAVGVDSNTFYVVGMWWDPQQGIKMYIDGKQVFNYDGPVSATPQDIIFSIESKGDPSNPFEVDWFRYYADGGLHDETANGAPTGRAPMWTSSPIGHR